MYWPNCCLLGNFFCVWYDWWCVAFVNFFFREPFLCCWIFKGVIYADGCSTYLFGYKIEWKEGNGMEGWVVAKSINILCSWAHLNLDDDREGWIRMRIFSRVTVLRCKCYMIFLWIIDLLVISFGHLSIKCWPKSSGTVSVLIYLLLHSFCNWLWNFCLLSSQLFV